MMAAAIAAPAFVLVSGRGIECPHEDRSRWRRRGAEFIGPEAGLLSAVTKLWAGSGPPTKSASGRLNTQDQGKIADRSEQGSRCE